MITPERLRDFVALVIEVRAVQRHYRRTQDPRARWKLPDLERQLDAETDVVAAELEQLRPLLADPDRPAWIAEADAEAARARVPEGGAA